MEPPPTASATLVASKTKSLVQHLIIEIIVFIFSIVLSQSGPMINLRLFFYLRFQIIGLHGHFIALPASSYLFLTQPNPKTYRFSWFQFD